MASDDPPASRLDIAGRQGYVSSHQKAECRAGRRGIQAGGVDQWEQQLVTSLRVV